MPEIPTLLTVSALALVAADGRICLQRRPAGKAHAGLWEFPGGKIEPGESPESALVREIAEELGIILESASLTATAFSSSAGEGLEGAREVVILLYTCKRWEGEVRGLEGQAVSWFAPEAIAELAMPPLDYPLAARLCQLLSIDAI